MKKINYQNLCINQTHQDTKKQQTWNTFMINKFQCCRVCGLYFDNYFPWGETGEDPSHDICPCCGTEFGYEDFTIEGTKEYRKEWLNNKAKWWSPKEKPLNWSLEEQIKNTPKEFL